MPLLPFAWIEDNLVVLGLAAVLAGFMLGVVCSVIKAQWGKQVHWAKPATGRNVISSVPLPPSAKPPLPARKPGDGPPRVGTVHRLHPNPEPISRTGPRRRTQPPARRA